MNVNVKIKSLLKFTNLLVKKGKKSKAASIFFKTLFLLKKKTKNNPINLMYSSIKMLTPGVSTRKTVVAGRLYNLPCAISSNKSLYFGCNWLQQSATSSKEGSKTLNLSEKLANECLKVLKKKGNAILMLKQHNKSVSDNRPFLRFVKRKRTLRLPRKVFLRRRKMLYLKRRTKTKKIFPKLESLYEYTLNSDVKIVPEYSYDTKMETKLQSKLDKKFGKVDKKREFSSQVKNLNETKSKSKIPNNQNQRKLQINSSRKIEFKNKNKTINKKN
jgi:small subunit ribosomal protein S7